MGFCCKELVLAVVVVIVSLFVLGICETDPNDLHILNQFSKGLSNPQLLNWPANGGDPCGSPRWDHIYCSGNRVSQIQVQNLGLRGPLPQNLNQLVKLSNLGLQRNQFTGMLPSLSGLSDLRYAYFDYNHFDSIPFDFFDGLTSLQVMALDGNPLNSTTGWSLPVGLQSSSQLTNLSCINCSLVGPLPDYLGSMPSLSNLLLSMNRISGAIPASFNGSSLQMLWLNDQSGGGMTGPIIVVSTMLSLSKLWLHGNHFSGSIPVDIGNLASLKDLNLNTNDLVGLVPDSLANLELDNLDLNNNHLMGPIPKFQATNVSYSSNSFCRADPGAPCAPAVMALLGFLGGLNYPWRLINSWLGNDPCGGEWLGIGCDAKGNIVRINLSKFGLNGTLSPSLAEIDSLSQISLSSNNITGPVPRNWTDIKSLTLLDLSGNNISQFPNFRKTVNVVITGNPLLSGNGTSTFNNSTSAPGSNSSLGHSSASNNSSGSVGSSNTKMSTKLIAIVAPVASVAIVLCIAVPLFIYCARKRKETSRPPSFVVHPRDASDPENAVKIVVANNIDGRISTMTGSVSASRPSSVGNSHVIEAGNLVISVQVLRDVTKNFSSENELGRGGFGVVYKGELDDGTKIAVKRMEGGVISSRALDEFHAEIAVLSKVRHRHLVSLLGYSVAGNERLLVYEYMPQGALSKHLFHWKRFNLDPVSWKRRLNIALDVARGMEYLHSLAHQSFIHRDLKSSNILLADDFKAKVSDFGLVKLAPDGEKSVATRLAGTFGYLAPEYAVMGKVTTKVDVFSFGVVLMELLTGMMALDEHRPEESQYLAAWFWNIKSDEEKLMAAIDPTLPVNEDTFDSISIISELAGHCTAREPNQRPDMGHAVNVLAPLVEKWKPFDDNTEEYSGIDFSLPLTQMVKGWQESEGKDFSYLDLEDSKDSIPTRPSGFADSFTSADGR